MHHLSLFWTRRIQPLSRVLFLQDPSSLFFHLRLGLSCGLFPAVFPTKTLYTFLLSPLYGIFSPHLWFYHPCIFVSCVFMCCTGLCRGLCDGLITRPGVSYWVSICFWSSASITLYIYSATARRVVIKITNLFITQFFSVFSTSFLLLPISRCTMPQNLLLWWFHFITLRKTFVDAELVKTAQHYHTSGSKYWRQWENWLCDFGVTSWNVIWVWVMNWKKCSRKRPWPALRNYCNMLL